MQQQQVMQQQSLSREDSDHQQKETSKNLQERVPQCAKRDREEDNAEAQASVTEKKVKRKRGSKGKNREERKHGSDQLR